MLFVKPCVLKKRFEKMNEKNEGKRKYSMLEDEEELDDSVNSKVQNPDVTDISTSPKAKDNLNLDLILKEEFATHEDHAFGEIMIH